MDSEHEASIEQEVRQFRMHRPHVVILGAGASRAAFLDGDKNGNSLPLMKDFAATLGITELLKGWGIDPTANFEEIFSNLSEKGEASKIKEVKSIVKNYFNKLEIPERPTIYDYLLLSLRDTDVVATFNWDPLLLQAYGRSKKAGLSLPKLAFLHGNVLVAYCEKDKLSNLAGTSCRKCGKLMENSPLLYPIKNKNYSANLFIKNEWQLLKSGLKNAFMVTIFGYSAPQTDQEARKAMQDAWGDKNQRAMEQTAFITTQSEEKIQESWEPFIHTHHYESYPNFYDSWIANHPRRTGEAYINQFIDAKFIENNPIPKDLELIALWDWFNQFKEAETTKL